MTFNFLKNLFGINKISSAKIRFLNETEESLVVGGKCQMEEGKIVCRW